ncbi:AI-2E family transporter [Pleomorphomonas diazotrophica]|uniref:AI-2E family transporter n=1 Tax=Pleomorphomonas diazotrophica TaxID=1166257 RepID=A0A1I4SEY3_9HYPH|nr:AI-2E family transporter [Pleomorphomonas diazotrophica]PKR88904.1 AI-2E family transporter [Pleomorphomonas diazotrophica]SFM62934.1 Predicted PurR-regulated permease PerM [Pleomorphomonas diazotrophica]
MTDPRSPLSKDQPRWLGAVPSGRVPIVPLIAAARWLLLLIIVAGIYFFSGFVVPVLAALVIGFATWPLFRDLTRLCDGNTKLSASIALVCILLFLIVPMLVAVSFAFDEFKGWFNWLLEANRSGVAVPPWIATFPMAGDWLAEQWNLHVGPPGAIGELVQMVSGANIGNIYRVVMTAGGEAFRLLLMLLFMMIALFFVYKDGSALVEQIDLVGERILPTRWGRISRIVPATISSTVTGMTLIAIGEGIVLGVAYWIAGVPSPAIFGVITGVMALIPGGAPLSFTLISLYLVASGHPVEGAALFAWGTVELFIVDKTLRPRLVGGPIKLPFLPTFFGLVGGVKTMGFLGLFIGPVLMALLVAIWREWLTELRSEETTVVVPPPREPPAAA